MSRPKKSLGQNFLHDANIARKIVASMGLHSSDCVVEIGPGKGALTTFLLEKLPRLTGVELDDELAAGLRTRFGEKLALIHDDVLNVDLRALAKTAGSAVRIAGNIPYNITSPILFWVIDARESVRDCTLMMQREVARRLTAKPRTKEYGILSVFAQYYAAPKLLFSVSPKSFTPAPEVTSAVVHLDFRSPHEPQARNDKIFRAVVRGTFGKRRKTLRNGLHGLGVPTQRLKNISFPLDRRPEELSVADFISLADELTRQQINIAFHTGQAEA
ncbi:MAG: 16S rRNA (adenine(1518)-N(6)/adenine(1519)-N(6))-dimethyltransferase RsmA [Bacteroidota bacterium]|nr:16S rRNA (adenine(1518)-N(6)/adenine(1519)-N(6))-dimethyltransferase RsmA [Bacteroidota bacterium]